MSKYRQSISAYKQILLKKIASGYTQEKPRKIGGLLVFTDREGGVQVFPEELGTDYEKVLQIPVEEKKQSERAHQKFREIKEQHAKNHGAHHLSPATDDELSLIE
jgi:hypothetical protein